MDRTHRTGGRGSNAPNRASGVSPGSVLPVADAPRRERADADRNRRRILDAATRLLAERGIDGLAMDEVAAAAAVGVGTLYRRFGNRAGLAYALLDERERAFQAAFLAGPPPLGPGAPATDRIRAFLHAYVDYLESAVDLLAMGETAGPGARYRSAAYRLHQTHLASLLRQVAPRTDADYLADALLAPLLADLYRHQRRERQMDPARIKAGLDTLISGLGTELP